MCVGFGVHVEVVPKPDATIPGMKGGKAANGKNPGSGLRFARRRGVFTTREAGRS
jgi:hypothetical protein